MANYFKDRVVQHPGRVTMSPVSGQSDTYDVTRAEGTVTEEGTPFNADTFNEIAQDIIDMIPKGNGRLWYGTCSTGASTSAKVVTCAGFTLTTGAMIAVRFNNEQTSTSTITLNVNSTGAKSVYGVARSTTSITRMDGAWEANETKIFVYDGTYWRIVNQNIITSAELTSLETALGI